MTCGGRSRRHKTMELPNVYMEILLSQFKNVCEYKYIIYWSLIVTLFICTCTLVLSCQKIQQKENKQNKHPCHDKKDMPLSHGSSANRSSL